jgi:hypothetical protein
LCHDLPVGDISQTEIHPIRPEVDAEKHGKEGNRYQSDGNTSGRNGDSAIV